MIKRIKNLMNKPANELTTGDSLVYTLLLMVALMPICLLPVFIQWVGEKIDEFRWKRINRKED